MKCRLSFIVKGSSSTHFTSGSIDMERHSFFQQRVLQVYIMLLKYIIVIDGRN